MPQKIIPARWKPSLSKKTPLPQEIDVGEPMENFLIRKTNGKNFTKEIQKKMFTWENQWKILLGKTDEKNFI